MVYNRHSFIYLIFETKLVSPKLALNLHSPCLGYKSARIIDMYHLSWLKALFYRGQKSDNANGKGKIHIAAVITLNNIVLH